jgi:hypothetical protein
MHDGQFESPEPDERMPGTPVPGQVPDKPGNSNPPPVG